MRHSKGRRQSYDWSGSSPSDQSGETSQTYWSPAGQPLERKPRKTKTAPDTANLQFKRRDSVEHPSFGVGTVIESRIVGGDEEVTVAFPGVGIKKLAASMANLKKL